MTLRPLPLFFLSLPAFAGPIEVAVIDAGGSGSSAKVVSQLNDDTYFDFNATLLSPSDLTSVSDLDGYFVVVLGESGSRNGELYSAAFTGAIDAFNKNGGGVVSSSWYSYNDSSDTGGAYTPIDQASSDSGYCTGSSEIAIASTRHPVTDGITSFTDTTAYWEAPGPAERLSVVLASCQGKNAITVADATDDRGPQAYLGGLYFGIETTYRNTVLRSGSGDRLLEQAVAWASSDCEDLDEDGVLSCQKDCDDTDPLRFPGNTEVCDGIDNDCDGAVPIDEVDEDGDGARVCDADCDDADAERFPGNPEVCDGIDNDCDDVLPADESDADLDGVSTCDGDCADDDLDRFPGNPEACNDVDNDCDGTADNGLPTATYFPDGDADGWGDANSPGLIECAQPEGTAVRGGDCDDANADIYPEATDIPDNGIDEDCEGGDAVTAEEGCGCSTGTQGGWMWLMLAPALLLRRRKG
ncbi:MAG: MopE-related protein [Myxococcota bacterium]